MKYNSTLFISAAMTLKGCVLEQFQSEEINTTITHMGLPFMQRREDNTYSSIWMIKLRKLIIQLTSTKALSSTKSKTTIALWIKVIIKYSSLYDGMPILHYLDNSRLAN